MYEWSSAPRRHGHRPGIPLQFLDEAVKLGSGNGPWTEALLERGKALAQNKQYGSALVDLDTVLAAEPTNERAQVSHPNFLLLPVDFLPLFQGIPLCLGTSRLCLFQGPCLIRFSRGALPQVLRRSLLARLSPEQLQTYEKHLQHRHHHQQRGQGLQQEQGRQQEAEDPGERGPGAAAAPAAPAAAAAAAPAAAPAAEAGPSNRWALLASPGQPS